MQMMKRTLIALVAVTMIPLTISCDDETPAPQLGDLIVAFRVGSGSQTCEDVGITDVRVYVNISATEELIDETVACDPANQTVTFNDVQAGTYTIRVEGLDDNNNPIYAGELAAPFTVVANQTNETGVVVLNQLRPAMEIFFGFEDVGGCDRFGVVDLVVVIYENGSSIIHDESYPCATQITSSLLIENLSATSQYDLRVRGTNDNGEYTYEYNRDAIAVAPGLPTEVSAVLSPCTGLCDAP